MQQNPEQTNKRKLRVAPFILALLCFFLPFVQVSCRGQKVIALTGSQLVTGVETNQKDPITGEPKTQKVPSEKWVVFAFICTAAAAGLCFASGTASRLLPGVLGVAGFICMLVVKMRFDNEAIREGGGLLTVEYLSGFIATSILLLAGAAISGYHYNEAKKSATVEVPLLSPRVKQFIQRWVISTLAVALTAVILKERIHYTSWEYLLLASLLLGIFNAFIRPIMMLLALPLLIFTLGLFMLVINASLLWLVGVILKPNFVVDSFGWALLGSVIISVVSLALNVLTGTNKARFAVRRNAPPPPSKPGGGNGPVIDV